MDRSPGDGRKSLLLQAALLAASCVFLFGIAGSNQGRRESSPDDQLLVADFVDGTGENALIQGLRQMLILALDQSPHFRIFPESRSSRIMSAMRPDPGQGMTPEIASAICSRERIPYLLIPSLNRLGDSYLLSARLVRVSEGRLQQSIVDTTRVNDKADLILALSDVSAAVRRAMGESDQAIATTGRVLEKSAVLNAEALTLFCQALALGAKKSYEGELSVLQQSVLLNPHLALAQLKLGELYLRAGWREAAAAHAGLAVRDQGSLPFKERHRALAIAFTLRQEYNLAREQYRLLVERYPRDPNVQVQLAAASALEYDFASARDSFERAVRLDDSRVDAYLGLCMAFLYEGNIEAARKAWEAAGVLEPDDPGVLATSGLIDIVNNDLGSALRTFGRIADSASARTNSRGLFLAAQARIYGGRFESALTSLAEGVEADVHRNDLDSVASKRLARAGVYLLLGDQARAVDECRQIPEAIRRAEDIARIGAIYAQARRISEAQDQLRRVEGLPDSAWVRYQAAVLLGEIELASGRPQAAIQLLTRAREILPGCRPLEPLARALVQARQYEQAEREYRAVCQQKAVVLFPPGGGWFMGTWPNSLFETARCLDSLGKKEDALQYYRNYLWVLDGADPGLANVLHAREQLKKSSSRKRS